MTEEAERTRSDSQRLDAFVDAAFAFAVSLLIIAGSEPLRSFDDLIRALYRIPAFLGGFSLIALFWLAHRSWARVTPHRDGWSTLLSLGVVFSVLVFVFPLRLLTETAAHYISGRTLPGAGLIASFDQLAQTYLIYGLGFAVLSSLLAALFARALAGLKTEATPDMARLTRTREWTRCWILAAAAGVLSGLIAVSPILKYAPWLPGCFYWLIPIGIGVLAWADGRKRLPAQPPTEAE